jgi:23S rRNA pseudouridine955/2504/2580 synthase/23S rRNA pseudouridine1911/1915/1917 synthase
VKRKIQVIYSDASIVVVDKPAGMLSIPDRYDVGAPVALDTLQSEFGKLYVVHRIDADTSGVLLYARDPEAHRTLNREFEMGEVEKSYISIVRGGPESDEWICDLALRVDGDKLHRTIVDLYRGKEARTRFTVLERFRDYSVVQARPETGRTHQIRVHCAASGYPIVADPLYGDGKALLLSSLKRGWKGDPFGERPLIARTCLHAEKIHFKHPATGEVVEYTASIPRDIAAALAQLRKL